MTAVRLWKNIVHIISGGLSWDVHVSVLNWLSLCLGGGSKGLATVAVQGILAGVLVMGTLTAHPNPFTGAHLFDSSGCTLLASTFALTLGDKLPHMALTGTCGADRVWLAGCFCL